MRCWLNSNGSIKFEKNKKFAWQMQNMVYIKRHAKSERTSTGWFEIRFQKNEKIFQIAFDKVKKCAILNSCRASIAIVSKNDQLKKSLKKNQTALDKVEKYAILRTRHLLSGGSLKDKKLRKWELLMFLEKLNSANGPDLSGERSKTLEGIRFGRFF